MRDGDRYPELVLQQLRDVDLQGDDSAAATVNLNAEYASSFMARDIGVAAVVCITMTIFDPAVWWTFLIATVAAATWHEKAVRKSFACDVSRSCLVN